jgi:hypothetical protein
MTLSIKPFKISFFSCHDKSLEQMRSQRYWNTISSSSSSLSWSEHYFCLLIYLFRCCCCWRRWRWFRWLYINIIVIIVVTRIIAIIIVDVDVVYSSTFWTLCIDDCTIPRRTLLLLLVLGGLGGFTYYNSYFDYPL